MSESCTESVHLVEEGFDKILRPQLGLKAS